MEISNILINWYGQNKRDLPWRTSSDPYIIWVSEIILQQTRVDQGTEYFTRFITRFPDVYSLAEASEQEVLKLWQGLGYYTRARNMHASAKIVVENLNGIFPGKSEEMIKLKGIGPYTAAAIASICFAEPTPVVDGNVMRVIARLFGITKAVNTPEGQKEVHEACTLILDRKHPGEFNQAIMEFGALQCKPVNPACVSCPLQLSCIAFRTGEVEGLPLKIKPAQPRARHFNYLAVIHPDTNGDQAIYIKKRTGRDIWEGLYELPLIEMTTATEPGELYGSEEWNAVFRNQPLEILEYSNDYKHQLSHQTIHARFVLIKVQDIPEGSDSWLQVKLSNLSEFPVPRLIDRYFKYLELL